MHRNHGARLLALVATLAFVVTSAIANAANDRNYQGLWWNAPADSESGWGINFAHQGDTIFATWFTYDTSGKAWWLAMTANRTADATYSGTLFDATGPAFDAVPFDSAKFKPAAVGTGTLQFTDENNGTFSYTVNGTTQTKTITRQVFGALPTCMSASKLDPATATNYQDLWWNAPGGTESGWGINLTHQGDAIFATWFTYGADGQPMWLSVTAFKTADRTYSGDLARTTGPAFSAVPFDAKGVAYAKVGTATFAFTNGKQATFAYTVDGVSQTKTIVREVFVEPGTVCTTTPVDTSTTKGVWAGATNFNELAFALLLDDGRYEFIYAKPGTSDDINVVIGTASTTGGTFVTTDSTSFPIAQSSETTGFATSAAVSGSFGADRLQLTITTPLATRTFSGSFVRGSDQPPSLATIAGTYSGFTGHTGGRRGATLKIDAAGNLSASNDVDCTITGTVAPRPAVHAFDWHATPKSALNCIFGRSSLAGILHYDDATGRLRAFAPFTDNAGGADEYFFIGTKN